MISKIRSAARSFFFPTWSIPIALLALTILSYGLRADSLGFFWDDWPYLWFFDRLGAPGIWQAFTQDRPFLSIIYIASLSILGHSPQNWQIFALLAHWLYSLGFWWMLSNTWPENSHKAAWAAFLFVVYPGFTGHWISVIYGQAYLLFSFVFISIALTLWLARRRQTLRRAWLAAGTLLALLLSAFTMFSTEYFFGVELLRPILLWIVLSAATMQPVHPKEGTLRRQFFRTALWWAPHLALMITFVIWRGFIKVFEGYQLSTLKEMGKSPFSTLQNLSLTVFGDLIESSLAAWGQTLQLNGILEMNSVLGIRWLAVTLFTLVVVTIYLARLCPIPLHATPSLAEKRPHAWSIQAVIVGVLALLVAGIPFWITGLPMRLSFPQDRFSIMLSIGGCLFLAGLIDTFARGHLQKIAMLGLLIALAAGFHFNTSGLFQTDWKTSRDFFWQLTWRAPNVKENTLFLTAQLPLRFFEDDSLTAPLNWTYDPDGQSQEMDYLLYDLVVRKDLLKQLNPGFPVIKDFRATQFHGSTSNVVAIWYAPPGCVKVLDPVYDADLYRMPEPILSALPLSNPRQQIAAGPIPAEPPADLFGTEPSRRWCYYYEKAELARQNEDWETIYKLKADSIGRGYHPEDPYEYLPFIEAFAHLGLWEDAYQLTESTYQKTHLLRPALCAAWRRAIPDEQTAAQGLQEPLENVQTLLNCSIP